MIGKIKKVPLREVWKNEASNFTTWLEENIDSLSEVLGFELTIKEREQQVGSFSLDLLAETQSGSLVVIENQLEKSDHTHLGQILTYMTNLSARIAIWITSEARQEHINVVNWLNEQTENQFYLICIETLAIDNSKPAPYFNIKCQPDVNLRDVGIHKKEFTETGKANLELWTELIERCKDRLNHFTTRTPSSLHYFSGSSGKSGFTFAFLSTKKFWGIELYIDAKDADTNEHYFNKLFSAKNKIEKNYGYKLEWDPIDDKRACRIRHAIKYEIITPENRREVIESLISHMEKFENAIRPEIVKLEDQELAA